MKLLLDIVDSLLSGTGEFLAGGLESLLDMEPKLLEADFGNERELFSQRHDGVSLGMKSMTAVQSRNNVLVTAPSGVGKTTVCLVPTAFNLASQPDGASMIINNPSGELSQMTNYFINRGYNVLKFDPNDPENSIHLSFLSGITTTSDIQKITNLIVNKSSKESNDFWAIKSKELIGLVIHFLITHAPKIHQNLGNAYFLLQNLAGNEDVVSGLFVEKSTEKQWLAYKGIIANSANTKASIISSAISCLSFIGTSETLCDLTSVSTFDVSRMRKEKIVLFLNCPISDMEYYRVLLGLFFEGIFTEAFRKLPSKTDKDIFLLIDEMSSIPMPNLATVFSNARKAKIPILGIFQSENQIYNNYGIYNGKTILTNACRIYMTGLTDECERLEKELGTYQYYEQRGNSKVLRSRPLMSANSIRTMSRNRVLVLPNGGMKPLYMKVKPYYEISKYVKYMNMDIPSDYTKPTPFRYKIQYLSLDKYQKSTDDGKK